MIATEGLTPDELACSFASGIKLEKKSAIAPLLNGLDVMFSASDMVNMFAEIFSENSNLNEYLSPLLFSPLELIWNWVIDLS